MAGRTILWPKCYWLVTVTLASFVDKFYILRTLFGFWHNWIRTEFQVKCIQYIQLWTVGGKRYIQVYYVMIVLWLSVTGFPCKLRRYQDFMSWDNLIFEQFIFNDSFFAPNPSTTPSNPHFFESLSINMTPHSL